MPSDHFTPVDGISLHWLDHAGGDPPIVLLHGLTANARIFDGLVASGLAPRFRTIVPDLRGRGLSSQPATGYSIADHAADILGLCDALGLSRVVLAGHSFGGLLAVWIAAKHPERVERLIVLDVAGPSIQTPEVYRLIAPSLERLGKTYPSWEEFLATMRAAPSFHDWWDPAIEAYYRADVEDLPDGKVRVRTRPETIAEVAARGRQENWEGLLAGLQVPTLLVTSRGSYGGPGTSAIVPREAAQATAETIPGCRWVEVPGNHATMLFGKGAEQTVSAIAEFVSGG
jgi:pimeloyl-ACP methyl ester carboxylesterase